MKRNLLILLIIAIIVGFGLMMMKKGPSRSELVFAGNYQSFESASASINSDKVTVLNFYASRCPSCRMAHDKILSEAAQLPSNLQILNVDYDSNKALRDQYGVTSQHTFVLIDRDGNKIKSAQGLNTVSEVIAFVGPELLSPAISEPITTSTGDTQTGDTQDPTSGSVQQGAVESTAKTSAPEPTTTKPEAQVPAPIPEATVTQPEPKAQAPTAGIYTSYESGRSYLSDTSKKVVLFFRASRCPNCTKAEADIIANKDNIDPNLVILKVDYDTATDLKKQYGITMQTNYVLLNSDGSMNKKTTGLLSLDAIQRFA